MASKSLSETGEISMPVPLPGMDRSAEACVVALLELQVIDVEELLTTIAEWLDVAVLVCNSSDRAIIELADDALVVTRTGGCSRKDTFGVA